MTSQVARPLGCAAEDVLVCSTGVIGRFLPREKLADGIPAAFGRLAASSQAFRDAATAMMTTDTFPKLVTRFRTIAGAKVTVSGVAKGAAMIAPNMATMLAVIMTDAPLGPQPAGAALRHAVERSFNCISVDGHMSTSDTVLLLSANPQGIGPLGPADHAPAPGDDRRNGRGAGAGHHPGCRRGRPLHHARRPRAPLARRGVSDRQGDRRVAARENGNRRRRSELGTDHLGSGLRGCRPLRGGHDPAAQRHSVVQVRSTRRVRRESGFTIDTITVATCTSSSICRSARNRSVSGPAT